MALFSFDKKENGESVAGLDIGTYSIKILQIKKEGDKAHIETYGELEMAAYDDLPPGSISNIGEEKTIKAIKDLLVATNISTQNIVFSIPLSECFISSITIPKVSDKEILSIVPIEARKYLPMPISEVEFNYWRIKNNDDADPEKETIMITAIKNSILDMYKRYTDRLGLKKFSFEIESIPQARVVLNSLKKEEKNILALDIGGKVSFVTLLHNKEVRATNIIQKGSYDNTSQISKVLNLSIDVAEEAKRIFGYLGDDSSPHLAEVMGLASFPLFDEIKHLLLGYERKYSIIIEKVVITGGGALQKGIKEILSEFLNKEVVVLDVFSKLSVPEKLKEAVSSTDEKYAVCTGLVLKDFIK